MMGGKMFEFDKPSFYLFICKSAVWIVGFTHGITSRAKYTTRQPLARACQAAKPDERLGVATVRWRRLERKWNIHRGDSARMQSISPPPPPKQMNRMNPYPIPARARLGLACHMQTSCNNLSALRALRTFGMQVIGGAHNYAATRDVCVPCNACVSCPHKLRRRTFV